MSRIELALEKAAKLRRNLGSKLAAKDIKNGSLVHVEQHDSDNATFKPVQPLPQNANPLIATLSAPHSQISEEYRKLKSVLSDFALQDNFNNVFMVTSSVSCEGKSLTSLNLAITLAQEFDHTVLLIDADLRKPSIHEYLGVKNGQGLSDYLTGQRDLADLFVKTDIGKLTLLLAGTPQRNPVELFSSQKMKDFVSEIKNRYSDRFVIIDCPPILPFAEARSLSAIVDGVIFVIREGQATPENILEAIGAFDREKLVGAVYTDSSISSSSNRSHYYYYGYSHDSQSGQKNVVY